ncbi:MAG TPA: hypothetical protein VMW42_05805 [Desulfatiglandales bacterium]|nr:hypothetical protein [Desulfatiglandales bacterium]
MGRKRNRKKTLAVKKAGPPESARQTADKLRRINVWSARLKADSAKEKSEIEEQVRVDLKAGRRLYRIAQDVEKDFGIPDTEAIRCVLNAYRESIQRAANLR